MHIKIIIKLINLLVNQIQIENAGFQNQAIDLPHLINKRMIRFELILLFDPNVIEHFDDFAVEAELGVVDGDIAESVLAEHGALGDQVTHDFGSAFRGGQVQGSAVVCVEGIYTVVLGRGVKGKNRSFSGFKKDFSFEERFFVFRKKFWFLEKFCFLGFVFLNFENIGI